MAKKNRKKDPFYAREAEKYANPIPSREFIMQHMDEAGESISSHDLLAFFQLDNEENQEALRRRLIAMERDGQIMRNRKGNYALVHQLELVKGKVLGHKDGFGFLVPDEGGDDIYLPSYQMRSLFPGDRVLVRVLEEPRRGRREGIVVEILERNTHELVGRYVRENHVAFVEPHQKGFSQDVLIPPGDENGAKNGQYVVVSIVNQPTTRRQATGKIIEIVGDIAAPGVEVDVAIRAYDLPHRWPEEMKGEVASLAAQKIVPEAIRKDLRHLHFVTIDGEDAKDFDDAVYCEAKSKSGWRLFVAIADVSHYVKTDMLVDKEAKKRGNSVYFPSRVIPMLPEVLSNDLCSLRPNEDRYALVCEMEVSAQGELQKYVFYNALIHSHARLTYTEVAAMLQNERKRNALWPYIHNLNELYKILHAQRRDRGALEFESVDTRIIFSKDKKIKMIIPVERNDAHRIIEECMLLANVAAAKFLEKKKLPMLYRIHEGPKAEKLENLRDFLKGLGLRLGGGMDPTPMDYAKLLDRIRGRFDEHMIQTVLLRSLMQAVYSPENVGHFGLSYEAYTHFTSPIRRYPDLLIHRAIKHALDGKNQKFAYNLNDMERIGEHCSVTERRADDATRDAVDWLKCHFMRDKLGREYDGVITGVTSFGVFVELSEVYIEGLVHISSLRNDYYHFDPVRHHLKGKHTQATYRLGDKIRVLVARVDLDTKQIDLELVQTKLPTKKKRKRRK